MDERMRLALIISSISTLLAIAACDDGVDGQRDDAGADSDTDTDTDSDSDADVGSDAGESCTPSTAEEVCAKVFACGGWGWPDQATCESCFVDGSGTDCAAYETSCADGAGYLGCMCDCIDLADCAEFGTCEGACWIADCVE
jgi:hypothetical protein